jgi:hypothetical protein
MDNILYITRIDLTNPLWKEVLEKEAQVQDTVGRILVSMSIVQDQMMVVFSKK